MSIETSFGAYVPLESGDQHLLPLAPLSDEFEKLKSTFGFSAPIGIELDAQQVLHSDEPSFANGVNGYVTAYLRQNELTHDDNSDVLPYRGILTAVAQLYYERQHHHVGPRRAHDRARSYQYKEYIRTIDEDMRSLGEPENEHIENLLRGFDPYYDVFPKSRPVKFNTNIMYVLTKIDPNLLPIRQSL